MNRLQKWRICRKYSSLGSMIRVFFSPQDCDSFGETIEVITQSYQEVFPGKEAQQALKTQIKEMLETTDDVDLSKRMSLITEEEFNPVKWGETWRSFLLRVLAVLE
ncbi:hypothetical protein B1H58_14725 [Pantoea alhagi]|uniref:CdiI immunity protein domain-containing protein n=1 Tax=Pantoea alhagi TaxID=1891675 RepID=A0A1W6B7U4_9GAMM|nr:contact-dependent growth inhibition system immunity protein [Pantoea alhagi]ARJ43160.1 hypothetical protein B1H58_14725 [Pantoea alhagi]